MLFNTLSLTYAYVLRYSNKVWCVCSASVSECCYCASISCTLDSYSILLFLMVLTFFYMCISFISVYSSNSGCCAFIL